MMLHPSGIDRARQALERGDRLPGGTLPAAIAESWQRCRDLGLDPRSIPNGEVTAFAEVTRKREKVAALRRLALAEMKLLHSQIAGSNFIIALGDAEGMVLDTISDQHFADSTAGRSVIPAPRSCGPIRSARCSPPSAPWTSSTSTSRGTRRTWWLPAGRHCGGRSSGW